MSLTKERYAVPGARRVPRAWGRGTSHWWAGVLLVSVGLLLMAPTVAGALASGVEGSGRDDVLHGSDGDERVEGLGGKDELYGGEGSDKFLSGDGDDFVEASDGERDLVSCGPGEDVASVDFVDLVADDCERAYPG